MGWGVFCMGVILYSDTEKQGLGIGSTAGLVEAKFYRLFAAA